VKVEIRNLVGGTATVCGPDLTVGEAADVMVEERIGSLGVIEAGSLVGIFTDRDVLRAVAAGADCTSALVEEWMTADPDHLSPEVRVSDAAEWLMATGYRHLPVVENGQLLGIVSIKDVLWAVNERESGGD
jgi:CBS domain-containing protein